mmetsp:Transcript_26214/g.56874  ORF Transcript_26214/g.56874 Transcript_26214/m.56874 type:complete len:506 (+) Transcript_26214:532-2049(+)
MARAGNPPMRVPVIPRRSLVVQVRILRLRGGLRGLLVEVASRAELGEHVAEHRLVLLELLLDRRPHLLEEVAGVAVVGLVLEELLEVRLRLLLVAQPGVRLRPPEEALNVGAVLLEHLGAGGLGPCEVLQLQLHRRDVSIQRHRHLRGLLLLGVVEVVVGVDGGEGLRVLLEGAGELGQLEERVALRLLLLRERHLLPRLERVHLLGLLQLHQLHLVRHGGVGRDGGEGTLHLARAEGVLRGDADERLLLLLHLHEGLVQAGNLLLLVHDPAGELPLGRLLELGAVGEVAHEAHPHAGALVGAVPALPLLQRLLRHRPVRLHLLDGDDFVEGEVQLHLAARLQAEATPVRLSVRALEHAAHRLLRLHGEEDVLHARAQAALLDGEGDLGLLLGGAIRKRRLVGNCHLVILLRLLVALSLGDDGLDNTSVAHDVLNGLPVEELHLEDKSGVGRDGRWATARPVGIVRLAPQDTLLALLHRCHTDVPALDYPALTEGEREQIPTIAA